MQSPSPPLKPRVLAISLQVINSPLITTSRKLKPVCRMDRNESYLINYTFLQPANVLPSPDEDQVPDEELHI